MNWVDDASVQGDVFEIQHFSLRDGPGIRSVVFLKGCPLRCLWCHNPEGQAAKPTPMLEMNRCRGCRACATVCPAGCHRFETGAHRFRADACKGCGRCVAACLDRAIHWVDRQRSVEEVLADVLRDKAYFDESGGGITVSGGEPTAQPEFVRALLRAAGRAGLNRAMETCGYVSRETFDSLLGLVELFLFDIKETDSRRHRRYTGVPREPILENLRYLHSRGARIALRCPIIPGCNDRESHIRSLGELYLSLPGLEYLELLPYHSLGVAKAEKIGIHQQSFDELDRRRVDGWNNMLRDMGVRLADG